MFSARTLSYRTLSIDSTRVPAVLRALGVKDYARVALAQVYYRPEPGTWLPQSHPASLSTGIVSGRSESRRPEAPLEIPQGLVQVPAPRPAHGPPAIAQSMAMPARMGPQA
eukprot:5631948-Prymnesium_polylepis.1